MIKQKKEIITKNRAKKYEEKTYILTIPTYKQYKKYIETDI